MEKIRVAIADDHNLVRKGFVAILQDEEFEVVADAPNGKELLHMLKAISPPAHVCLLDVSMPEMNGYETLVALKGLYPEMRFLILTQLEHEYIIIRMLKAGASGYMLKTTEPRELKSAIKTILDQPFYGNSLVNGKLISLVQKGEEYTKIALTKPEENFLKFCCSELTYKEIADRMSISERTAAFYRQQLFDKLHVQSRTGLALYALKLGLVPMDEM
jgi:two-component system invasion response regulator UvrY